MGIPIFIAEVYCLKAHYHDDVIDLRPNQRLSKQLRGWWFETLSRPLWRHCNDSAVQWASWCPNRLKLDCLFPTLFRLATNQILKLCIDGPLWVKYTGHPLATDGLPSQMANNTKAFSCLDVIMIRWILTLVENSPWAKWPSFRRLYFQMHFRECKVFYFGSNFTGVCSWGTNW